MSRFSCGQIQLNKPFTNLDECYASIWYIMYQYHNGIEVFWRVQYYIGINIRQIVNFVHC